MTEYTDKFLDKVAGKTQTITYESAIEFCATHYYASAVETGKRIDRRYMRGMGDTELTRSMERTQAKDIARAEAQMELIAMMFARGVKEVAADVAEKWDKADW